MLRRLFRYIKNKIWCYKCGNRKTREDLYHKCNSCQAEKCL